jgi:hypothetical protein
MIIFATTIMPQPTEITEFIFGPPLNMIRTLGATVDASERAGQLVGVLETRLAEVRSRAERLPSGQGYYSRSGTIH